MPSDEAAFVPALRDFSAQKCYEGLMRTLREDTFPHACLIAAPSGFGKRTLASLLAQWLLCSSDGEEKPCGHCAACVQVKDGIHPDVITLEAGKPIADSVKSGRTGIPVDDIREMTSRVYQHTFEGGRRIVLIIQAEKMMPAAQNALLKTLEEPPEGTMFLLTADSPELLLTTIRSRCRLIRLHAWPDAYISAVLARRGVLNERISDAVRLSGGSIGKAIALADNEAYWKQREQIMADFFDLASYADVLPVSTRLKDMKGDAAVSLLDTLEDLLHLLLLCRLGRLPAQQASVFPEPWRRMAAEAPLDHFSSLMDILAQVREMRQSNVTWQAILEQLLFSMMEERNKWSVS